MKFLPFLISSLITFGLIFLLNQPVSVNGSQTPPLGKFFSPFHGFWQNTKADDFRESQSFNFPALNGKVSVIFDNRMVPHIFADDHKDALFVQGYVTAQDRLWQMDISTRAASGRLAEILGEKMIKRDKEMRRRGMGRAAENMVASWKKDPESFAKLEAYVAGANAYLQTLQPKDYPIEFKLMNYAPEPWSVLKMAEFGMSMSYALCSREEDLELSNALQAFGTADFSYLFPEINSKQSPIIPEGTVWDFEPKERLSPIKPLKGKILQDSIEAAIGFSAPNRNYEQKKPPIDFLGSNNWAVSGSKTASGNAILANDPHLQMTLPAIWYEVQLKTPLHNTYGVAFPGLPGVVIGFNENVAWGTTNGAQDVEDWYKITWADDTKKSYLFDGKPTPVEERIEEIKIAGGETIFDTVKYTIFGPITSEAEDSPYKDMALKWIAQEAQDDFIWKSFWNFNTAKNHDDFIEATNNYGKPNQNFIFADKSGNIALKVSGKIPIRDGNAKLIRDGSRSANDWKGFIPQTEMPQVKNPERGFVSSANQNSVGASYPYPVPGIYENYRGRILNRKLADMSNITPEDMQRLQNDTYSILPEEMLPLLLKNLNTNELSAIEKGLVEILKNWNFEFGKDDIAPILFEEWRLNFHQLTWDEIYSIKNEMPIAFPNDWRLIEIMETDPNSIFFDIKSTSAREDLLAISTQSFLKMTEKLKPYLDDKSYTWSDYKSTEINHIARLSGFSRKNIAVGGYRKALNAIQSTAGPSWRMVVELGDEMKAQGIFPGGQSGHPGSKYYDNMIDDWAAGNYEELLFMKNEEAGRKAASFVHTFNSSK